MQSKRLYIMRDVDGVAQNFPIGETPAYITQYTYTAQRMGSTPQLTASFDYPRALGEDDWTEQEYVVINDEKYYILNTPTSKKTNDNLYYTHDATFVSERIVLEHEFFYDVVTDSTEVAYQDRVRSNLTEFSFMGTIEEFVSRLNDALVYVGFCNVTIDQDGNKTYDGYHVVIDGGVDTTEIVEVSFENQYLAAVIQEIFNSFNLIYYFVGKVCHVGDASNMVEHTFEYGLNKGLLDITDTNSGDDIVNRITGYGSSDNIPYYYPNDNAEGQAIFHTENFDKSLVGYIDTAILRKYVNNPFDCTLTFCEGESIDTHIKLSDCSIGDPAGIELECEYVEPTQDNDGGVQRDTLLVRYKVLGRLLAQIDFSALTIASSHTQSICLEVGEPTIYQKVWDDDDKTLKGAEPLLNNKTFEFDYNTWYMFAVVCDFSYYAAYGQGQLQVGIGNDIITYNPHITTGKFILTDDGTEIPLSKIQAIELVDVDAIPTSVITGSFADGQWTFTAEREQEAGQIVITGREYIYPAQHLMPSIFRESRGKERYYDAINKKYVAPTNSDDPVDEEGYYYFKNLYNRVRPHAAIQEFEDIKPTIVDMRNGNILYNPDGTPVNVDDEGNAVGELLGQIADIAYDENDSDETIQESESNSTTLTYKHSYFYIKLHIFNGDYGFNLFDHALESDTAKVSMLTGNCAACEFEIGVDKDTADDGLSYYFKNPVQVDEEGNIVSGDYEEKVNTHNIQEEQQDTRTKEVWIALKKEINTYNQVMPNCTHNYKPQVGDLFVLTGIKMPKAYVLAAEKRLDDALLEYMAENNREKFNFSLSLSRNWLERHPTIAAQISENAKIVIRYNDIDYRLYVTSYSIKADGNVLNEISVELSEDVTVQTSSLTLQLQDIKDQILRAVSNGSTSSSSAVSNKTIAESLVNYLRKDKADTTSHLLTSLTGFQVGNFLSGLLGQGGIFNIDDNGDSYLEVDKMLVRKVATFFEVLISQMKHVSGELVISPASMTISEVEVLPQAYRCYFENTKDGVKVNNEFEVGDLARCQTWNTSSERYWWRQVIAVGDDYIDVSNTYVAGSETELAYDDGSVAPLAGDNVVLLGSKNTDRQSAIILSTIGTDAPSIKMYHGIDSFSLDGKCDTYFAKSGNKVTGDFTLTSGDDVGTEMSEIKTSQTAITAKVEGTSNKENVYNSETATVTCLSTEDIVFEDVDNGFSYFWSNVDVDIPEIVIGNSYTMMFEGSTDDGVGHSNIVNITLGEVAPTETEVIGFGSVDDWRTHILHFENVQSTILNINATPHSYITKGYVRNLVIIEGIQGELFMSDYFETAKQSAQITLSKESIKAEVRDEQSEAGMEITSSGVDFTAGMVNFRSSKIIDSDGKKKKYIEITEDESGFPHLIFYGPNGDKSFDLAWTGTTSFIENAHPASMKVLGIGCLGSSVTLYANNWSDDSSTPWDSDTLSQAYQFSAAFSYNTTTQQAYIPDNGKYYNGLYFANNGIDTTNNMPSDTTYATDGLYFISQTKWSPEDASNTDGIYIKILLFAEVKNGKYVKADSIPLYTTQNRVWYSFNRNHKVGADTYTLTAS